MRKNSFKLIIIMVLVFSPIILPPIKVAAKGLLSPPCKNCTGGTCPISSPSGKCGQVNFPREYVSEQEENDMVTNCPVYTSSADKYGIPWEALAAIHFREGGFNPNGSVISGREIGAPEPDQGGMVFSSLQESADRAAEVLIGKNSDIVGAPADDIVKDAMFGYNGRASCYGSPDGSPYVMNLYDEKHMNMPIITSDGGGCDGIDTRPGAFLIYKIIKGER